MGWAISWVWWSIFVCLSFYLIWWIANELPISCVFNVHTTTCVCLSKNKWSWTKVVSHGCCMLCAVTLLHNGTTFMSERVALCRAVECYVQWCNVLWCSLYRCFPSVLAVSVHLECSNSRDNCRVESDCYDVTAPSSSYARFSVCYYARLPWFRRCLTVTDFFSTMEFKKLGNRYKTDYLHGCRELKCWQIKTFRSKACCLAD